jgi:hypothetical protein
LFCQSAVEQVLDEWKTNRKTGRELSFPDMLRDLPVVLSPDLVEYICESANGRLTFEELAELSNSTSPAVVSIVASVLWIGLLHSAVLIDI